VRVDAPLDELPAPSWSGPPKGDSGTEPATLASRSFARPADSRRPISRHISPVRMGVSGPVLRGEGGSLVNNADSTASAAGPVYGGRSSTGAHKVAASDQRSATRRGGNVFGGDLAVCVPAFPQREGDRHQERQKLTPDEYKCSDRCPLVPVSPDRHRHDQAPTVSGRAITSATCSDHGTGKPKSAGNPVSPGRRPGWTSAWNRCACGAVVVASSRAWRAARACSRLISRPPTSHRSASAS
jgi:hypothetical protein